MTPTTGGMSYKAIALFPVMFWESLSRYSTKFMSQHYPTFVKVLMPVTQLTKMIQKLCYKIIHLLHFYLTIKQSSIFGNILNY